ncbi:MULTISPECIES: GBS Bsp-like repeat-containing protein [Dorea]|uniref:GBS Bsp-like repeat-containing protein n=1 Tax=Dorea TaxID=189330 RepID=UPI000CF86104|nr:GBS Bsp-like repeat-containing protein [Dorea formicigenerans]
MKDINNEELLLRQGEVPTGEIAVGEYDYHTAALPVIAYNIANDDSIASVTAVVWHNEDQSDLQWVELPQNEDGTYSTNVNIANFNFVLGEYHIHVYAVNTDGQQYVLGEGMGSVQ